MYACACLALAAAATSAAQVQPPQRQLWAVQIVGGKAAADAVAQQHGFVNAGPIGTLADHYHFHGRPASATGAAGTRRRGGAAVHVASASVAVAVPAPARVVGSVLADHPAVVWAEQQVRRQRGQRRLRAASGPRTASPGGAGGALAEAPTGHRARRAAPAITDPLYGQQWHLHQASRVDMNVRAAWALGYTGKGVVVCVVDDGVEHSHPDLRANYEPRASKDINGNDADPTPDTNYPINTHGTRCAGEIGAVANDVCGVGVAMSTKIGAIRMLDGDVTDAVEADSLSHAPQLIDIYTNSWGPNDDGQMMEGPSTLTKAAIMQGITKGRGGKGSIYLFAAGGGGASDDCNADGCEHKPAPTHPRPRPCPRRRFFALRTLTSLCGSQSLSGVQTLAGAHTRSCPRPRPAVVSLLSAR